MSLTLFDYNPFQVACEKIETHRNFKRQMSDAELLGSIQDENQKMIGEHAKFITPSELGYLAPDGRAGRVYQILDARWEYDACPYTHHSMFPTTNKIFVLVVDADGDCTTHRLEHARQNNFITSREAINNIDQYLNVMPTPPNQALQPIIQAVVFQPRRNGV